MSRAYSLLKACVIIVAVSAALVGCPDNSRIVLIVAPSELNFDDSLDELTFRVAKSNTSLTMPPFVASSGSAGIILLDCTSPNDGCVSTGPNDPVEVRVRVDRSLMNLGQNAGRIRVEAQGIVTQFVVTLAISPVVADFDVDNRVPILNEDIRFTDRSSAAPGWEILSWNWDFGAGRSSTEQNPGPISYAMDGSFTVTLTITVTDGTITETYVARRENLIVVGDRVAPAASFTVSETAPFAGTAIQFTDTSAAGTSAIESWEWRFGEGGISREENPAYTYNTGGTFDVYLKIVTGHGFDEVVMEDFITVEVAPPVAALSVENTIVELGAPVQFTDESMPGSAPISSWLWDFGDGGISTEQDPVNVYLESGTFTVSLTVTTAHASDTVTVANLLEVTTSPPVASFGVDNRRALPGDTVRFSDSSDPGTAPITAWAWSFGDGSVSTGPNPTHQYTSTGNFEVALQVTTAHGQDFIVESGYIVVTSGTALDAYVRQEDSSYLYSSVGAITSTPGVTGHVIDMRSQTWRSVDDVDRPGWDHWLTIIEPATVTHSTALLFVTAGEMYNNAPTELDIDLAAIAAATESIVAVVEQTPNQPLQFTGDPYPRSGDSIIAFSFDRFLTSFDAGQRDDTWPALLPMVKTAVRAMDTVQTFLDDDRSSNKIAIEDFVVAGVGIRGWTAWLTAAVDGRVIAMAPMAHDFVNMLPQATHHLDVYGFVSETLYDYVESGVWGPLELGRLESPAGQALRGIVDPYTYFARYATLPKLIVSSTGDQSFVPDSSRFYLDALPGETRIAYIPNTDQGLDFFAIVDTFGPWYFSVIEGIALPEFAWTLESGSGKIELTVTPQSTVSSAGVWRTTSENRDFRFDNLLNQFPLPDWSFIPLAANGQGQYAWTVSESNSGPWEGFLIQLEFDSGFVVGGQDIPYVFTTEVVVAPDIPPPHSFMLPEARFAADNLAPTTNDAVTFTDESVSASGPVIRWLWSFGDGAQSIEANPSHTYNIPGQQTVTLTVTTVHGSDSLVKSNYVTVSSAAK